MTDDTKTSIGLNVRSFSEADDADNLGLRTISPSNIVAHRLAGELYFPLTHNLMLNTETVWKRNRGGFEINNQDTGSVDAFSISLFIGVGYTFYLR